MRMLPMVGLPMVGSSMDSTEERDSANALEVCPAAVCDRCGYEYPPETISAVCPRCLEPFARQACYGGCWSCPLTQ